MSRVEWTRLDGNDVEAVVAMFVNREHVNSVRITPSRGDGGVDILDRGAGPDGADVVYQVKRYSGPLTARQKQDVETSLRTLMQDERWSQLNVATWHLVTPWNPTPEAEAWLQHLGETHGLTAIWHGLTYVDQLAAKYPDVTDYYLHGGRNRIDEAYRAVIALTTIGDDGRALDVPEVVRKIENALPSLDSDPHYRYEPRFGEGPLPATSARPGLVMTWIVGHTSEGRWAAVDVIARCAASVQERPITVSGRFVVDSGDDFEETLRDFVRFGVPFASPEGVYHGVVDAPGGLGGPIEGATVTVSSVTDEMDANRELHLEILDPNGVVLAKADVDRVDRSHGTDGVRVVFRELHNVFTIEDRYNLREQTRTRNISFGSFAGAPVTAARSALTVLASCRPPNVARWSVRHTPAEHGALDPDLAFEWPDELEAYLSGIARVLDDLVTVQAHTSTVVRVPDFATVSNEHAEQWRLAANLLRGEGMTGTYPEGHCLIVETADDIPDPENPLTIPVPFAVDVDDQSIDLGQVGVRLDAPTLIERREHEGINHYYFTTPDRRVHYQRLISPE